MTVRRLLVGLDGSAGAQRALEWAAGLASGTDMEVVVVHVLTYGTELVRDMSFETMTNWRRDLAADLEGAWTELLRGPGAAVRWRSVLVESDSASSGLMQVAAEVDADLLVVGAQGHGGLVDRVLGGASYRLTHLARQPVVVVPRDRQAG